MLRPHDACSLLNAVCREETAGSTPDDILKRALAALAKNGGPEQETSTSSNSRLTGSKRKGIVGEETGPSQKKPHNEAAVQVQWSEDIPVNSAVLAAKSRVLRAMLSNGMEESNKSKPVVLKLTPEGRQRGDMEFSSYLVTGCCAPIETQLERCRLIRQSSEY